LPWAEEGEVEVEVVPEVVFDGDGQPVEGLEELLARERLQLNLERELVHALDSACPPPTQHHQDQRWRR
jgi:hypothetical protein